MFFGQQAGYNWKRVRCINPALSSRREAIWDKKERKWRLPGEYNQFSKGKCDATWLLWEIVAPKHMFIEVTIHRFKPKSKQLLNICLHNWFNFLEPGKFNQYLKLLVYHPPKNTYLFGSCGFGFPKTLVVLRPIILEIFGDIYHRKQLEMKPWMFSMEFSYRTRSVMGKYAVQIVLGS